MRLLRSKSLDRWSIPRSRHGYQPLPSQPPLHLSVVHSSVLCQYFSKNYGKTIFTYSISFFSPSTTFRATVRYPKTTRSCHCRTMRTALYGIVMAACLLQTVLSASIFRWCYFQDIVCDTKERIYPSRCAFEDAQKKDPTIVQEDCYGIQKCMFFFLHHD